MLGLVTATAVMGKPGQEFGDTLTGFTADLTQAQIDALLRRGRPAYGRPALLGNATTRVIYDIHGFYNSKQAAPDDPTAWRPPFAATIARETHSSAAGGGQSKLQIGFSYCDGFGREIQKKTAGGTGPRRRRTARWSSSGGSASGWTIYNNKGKPVRQYEPFFSQLPASGQQFEFGALVGVSPILCYDPPGRVVATIHPDHTYEKAVFDPWHAASWDVEDTVTVADPATDPDVGDFFARLPASDYLPTWYTSEQRRQPVAAAGRRERRGEREHPRGDAISIPLAARSSRSRTTAQPASTSPTSASTSRATSGP